MFRFVALENSNPIAMKVRCEDLYDEQLAVKELEECCSRESISGGTILFPETGGLQKYLL